MAYVIDHSDATFVLAKDQEQCDKLLEMRAQIPQSAAGHLLGRARPVEL
jgi:hypothetical protein